MIISVCMATYNGEKFIQDQLLSILSQLRDCDELIVSDDNSTDKTVDILNNMNDKRIKIVFNKRARGYTNNFQNALEHAKGDIIFLSDQDDIWEDNKVKICVDKLKYYDFVVSDATVVDENLTVVSDSNFSLQQVKHGLFKNIVRCRYLGACYAFRRNVLEYVLPFPNRVDLLPHDYWIYMIAASKFRVGVVNSTLIKYRRHSQNTSNGGCKSENNYLKIILIRLYLLFNLTLRVLRIK